MNARSLHVDENTMIQYCSGSRAAKAVVESYKFHEPIRTVSKDDPMLRQSWQGVFVHER